jgi:hypothetical protein
VLRSAGAVLVELSKREDPPEAATTDPDIALWGFGLAARMDRRGTTSSRSIQYAAIRRYAIRVVETDFDGRAQFNEVPEGNYWVFGSYQSPARLEYVVWDRPVVVTVGRTTSLILDEHNGVSVGSR